MIEVLVTGGAGSIGSHLVQLLIDTNYNVTVIDDLSSGCERLVPKEARFIKGSICDERALEDAFGNKPKLVFHLAALFANQQSMDRPVLDLTVNGIGTLNVLDFASRHNVEKLLYASSSCVYGEQSQILRENDGLSHLDTPYAATKLLGEHYSRIWAKNHSLPVVVVRLFNSYGPHEYPGKYRNVIPNFFSLALNRKPLPILGTGHETRDFTYVSDIVDGMVSAITTNTGDYDVINLGTGLGVSILDLANKINSMTDNPFGVLSLPRRNWDHIEHRVADITKARSILNYNPSVKFEDGLERTLEWFKRNNVN